MAVSPGSNNPAYSKHSSRSLSASGEGIALAQFARCGYDVLAHAGHDKPMHDLSVSRAGRLLKISVKASNDGQWGFAEPFFRQRSDDHDNRLASIKAVNLWRDSQFSGTVCCLVQFDGIALDHMPRLYLAAPGELTARMHESIERTGSASLREEYEWRSPIERITRVERLPSAWRFSPQRIEQLLDHHYAEALSHHHRVPEGTAANRILEVERRPDESVALRLSPGRTPAQPSGKQAHFVPRIAFASE